MRVGLRLDKSPDGETLRFAEQLGVTDIVVNTPGIPVRNGRWEVSDLLGMRTSVEAHPGLRLSAIETPSPSMRDHIIIGGPQRDQQLEAMCDTIRNIGRAGIPMLTLSWKFPSIYRTPPVYIRGGATATAFDYEIARHWPNVLDYELTEEQAWENLELWVRTVTPVAEEAGVRIGIHPNDPPVSSLGGVPQLFRDFDSFRRLLDIVDSPANSIVLCQGSFAQMADAANGGIYEAIEEFVKRDRVLYVHFRNVSSPTPDKFHEEFINTGHVDMYKAMRTYAENGFTGWFQDDHIPHAVGDSGWGHRAHAFTTGYIQALVEAVTDKSLHGAH